MMVGILTDITKCVGCERCVKACREENKCAPLLPEHRARPEELFHTRWTAVVSRPGPRFVRRQCRHCSEPACASVCPVGAMEKTAAGPVIYHRDRCIGCRYCMMACPFGIPRYEWSSLAPGVAKCTLCAHRIKEGKQPACTEACPEKATVFGKRDELLHEAGKRISGNPGRYLKKIFGERDVGGTSVLYISDIDLSFLGFGKVMGDIPLPGLSWKTLRATPAIAGSVVLTMTGLRWLIERRNRLRSENKKLPGKSPGGPGESSGGAAP